eukprot:Awhi_evm1s9729
MLWNWIHKSKTNYNQKGLDHSVDHKKNNSDKNESKPESNIGTDNNKFTDFQSSEKIEKCGPHSVDGKCLRAHDVDHDQERVTNNCDGLPETYFGGNDCEFEAPFVIKNNQSMLMENMHILKRLNVNHPNLVKLSTIENVPDQVKRNTTYRHKPLLVKGGYTLYIEEMNGNLYENLFACQVFARSSLKNIYKLLQALQYLHMRNIVHGDVSLKSINYRILPFPEFKLTLFSTNTHVHTDGKHNPTHGSLKISNRSRHSFTAGSSRTLEEELLTSDVVDVKRNNSLTQDELEPKINDRKNTFSEISQATDIIQFGQLLSNLQKFCLEKKESQIISELIHMIHKHENHYNIQIKKRKASSSSLRKSLKENKSNFKGLTTCDALMEYVQKAHEELNWNLLKSKMSARDKSSTDHQKQENLYSYYLEKKEQSTPPSFLNYRGDSKISSNLSAVFSRQDQKKRETLSNEEEEAKPKRMQSLPTCTLTPNTSNTRNNTIPSRSKSLSNCSMVYVTKNGGSLNGKGNGTVRYHTRPTCNKEAIYNITLKRAEAENRRICCNCAHSQSLGMQ